MLKALISTCMPKSEIETAGLISDAKLFLTFPRTKFELRQRLDRWD